MSQPNSVQPLSPVPTWASEALYLDRLSSADENGIYSTSLRSTLSAEFHDGLAQGPALRELESKRFHLANWEGPLYRAGLEKLMGAAQMDGFVFDAGCGDGRFTAWLLDQGFRRIVAFDQHYGSLASLREYIVTIGREGDVVLVHGDLREIPLRTGIFDLGFAIGVLYYLGAEFEEGLESLARAIKPEGQLIDSQPSLPSAGLLALLFEGLDDFIDVVKERGWIERHGATKTSFRSFSDSELKRLYGAVGLHEAERHPLSLFPLILRILQVRGQIEEGALNERELEIRAALSLLDGSSESAGLILRKLIKVSY